MMTNAQRKRIARRELITGAVLGVVAIFSTGGVVSVDAASTAKELGDMHVSQVLAFIAIISTSGCVVVCLFAFRLVFGAMQEVQRTLQQNNDLVARGACPYGRNN